MITTTDYFKQFADSKEITDQMRKDAAKLIAKVSVLLSFIPIEKPVITSGFRTQSYNKRIGGSTNSAHCFALAVDIHDPDKVIGLWCVDNQNYLRQEGLHIEDLSSTHHDEDPMRRWVHFTIRAPKSGKVIFVP